MTPTEFTKVLAPLLLLLAGPLAGAILFIIWKK
jgi:hypothetical protein